MKARLFIKAALISALLLASPLAPHAQDANGLAPGAPGKDAQWEGAGKQGVGTSATPDSKVWFTLRGGALTEVYYPTIDKANVQKLELIIVHGESGTVETETRDTTSRVEADKDS